VTSRLWTDYSKPVKPETELYGLKKLGHAGSNTGKEASAQEE